MTNINTQMSTIQSNVIAAAPVIQKTAQGVETTQTGGLDILKTTLTLSEDVQAEAITDDPEKGGLVSYEQPLTTLVIMSSEAQSKVRQKEMQEYEVEPKFKADAALTTLNTQLTVLQHKIEAVKPGLLGKKWDFVLKNDKIEVVGNLKSDEKQWLENSLNRNKTVLNAVKDVYASVVKTYEHTQEHPSAIAYENGENQFAYGVDEQINGKLPLRELMDKVTKLNAGVVGKRDNPFIDAIDLAKQYIKTSNQSVYALSIADMSDPATAVYMKQHPNFRL